MHALTNPPAPRRRMRRAAALCASAAALAVTGGAADASAASGPSLLAWGPVDRLEQSTGNLYWTTHYLNEFGPSTATVYRASKSNSPGLEQALYTEYYNGWFYFGDLTYALTSTWYGYFAVSYPSSNISRIKRVPLTGGSAVTLATSPSLVGMRDIVNDGSYLYWADATGLRKMAIGGGAITTLATGTSLSSVGLTATRVYYSSGAAIRSVPKTGGGWTQHVSTGSAVTAMHVHQGSAGTVVYWAEHNASVRSLNPSGSISTHQGALTGRRAWSVSFDGSRVLWSDCTYPNGNGCAVRKRQSIFTTTVSTGGVGASNVQGDASAMFFTDSSLKKYVH